MSNSVNKNVFTAVFEQYELGKSVFARKGHFRNVRLSEGVLIAPHIIFDEETMSRIQGHLTIGEYVSFVATIEFKDIEFQYPHKIEN